MTVKFTYQGGLIPAPAIRSIGIGGVVIGIALAEIATTDRADKVAVVTIAGTSNSAIGEIPIAVTRGAMIVEGIIPAHRPMATEPRDHHRELIKMNTPLVSSHRNCEANGETWGRYTSRDRID